MDKHKIARQFARAASTYDAAATVQRQVVDELLRLTQPLLLPNKALTIVDLGCGTGVLARLLVQQLPKARIIGIDLAAAMLREADSASDNIAWCNADIECLPLADNSIDLVFSSSSVQWVDLSLALPEIRRVLKANGIAALASFVEGTLASWHQLWGDLPAHQFISADAWQQQLADSGLHTIDTQQQQFSQQFASLSDATRALRQVGASGAANQSDVSLAMRSRYKYVQRQLRQNPQPIVHDYIALFSLLRKPALALAEIA